MDMRLSLLLITLFKFILSVEDRCRSYTCGSLTGSDCAVETVLASGNFNYTMQVCAEDSNTFCPWSSFTPGSNGTVECANNTTPTQKL
jgi:hypothetical protein